MEEISYEGVNHDGLCLSEAKNINYSMEGHMDIHVHERFAEEVVNDYFTANVKAEVILDTILTPVIGEILTVVCEEKGIKGSMKLLAKEFPILEKKEERKRKGYRSCNVDYLMYDNEFVYLVELKTTQDSYNSSQMENYIEKCGKNDTFAEKLLDFIDLLNHVSKTKIPDGGLVLEKWQSEMDALEWLFNIIIKYAGKDIKGDNYVSKAMCYLQSKRAVSSKKYLFTAGQMLDRVKCDSQWDKHKDMKIKLIYITPNKIPDKILKKREDIIYLTFEEIIKKRGDISKKITSLKIQEDLKNYWEWTADILERCMNCPVLKLESECTKYKECGCNRDKMKI